MSFTWYGPPLYRYRDNETGQFVAQSTILDWSQISIDSAVDSAQSLATPLANGGLGVGDWQLQMRQLIKDEMIRQYKLGMGAGEFSAVDYGSIGGMLADQYRYLDEFARKIANGELSEAQISMYSAMYLRSCREAYQRAYARSRGIDLPAYPGDGSSCLGLTNCNCSWDCSFREGRWECYWRLGVAEHCELCLEHEVEWGPYLPETAV